MRLAKSGVAVKALENIPELLDVDVFYLEMYNCCGCDINYIIQYCSLYDLSKSETLYAIELLNQISVEVA